MPRVAAGVAASKDPASSIASMASSSSSSSTAPTAAQQVAFTLPSSPDTRVYLHITNLAQSLVVHVATGSPASTSSQANLGTFVLAMPSTKATSSDPPSSTALYNRTNSIDFMNRFARALAKRVNKPVYVGGDVKFWTPEDEGEAMRSAVQVVLQTCGAN